MDILIKSFNRPYYLDRCLYTVKNKITQTNGEIYVLDDGTPQKYLNKIKEKYPDIHILKSNFYDEKSNTLGANLTPKIPIDFWVHAAKKASNYFLLLEDDYWVTENLNLDVIYKKLASSNVVFLKLFWLGNTNLISKNITKTNNYYSIINPKLLTKSPFWYKKVFHTYGFYMHKIMKKIGLFTRQRKLAYYHIYSVAGCVFKKDYFCCLWKNNKQQVDEGLQIQNTLKYLQKHTNSKIAQAKLEYFKTGFATAATISHKNYPGINLDMHQVNKLLNDAWFANQFNVHESLPNDFTAESILNILKKQDAKLSASWINWNDLFKQHYKSIGCAIE